ncbi:MAG: hypothetical protein ABL974_07660 [Prosthecobacter sp.]
MNYYHDDKSDVVWSVPEQPSVVCVRDKYGVAERYKLTLDSSLIAKTEALRNQFEALTSIEREYVGSLTEASVIEQFLEYCYPFKKHKEITKEEFDRLRKEWGDSIKAAD